MQIADSTYEDSGSTSLAGLLTANDPSQVLAEASLVLQITGNAEPGDRGLPRRRQPARLRPAGAAAHPGRASSSWPASGKTTKDHISSLLSKQNSILNSLTGAQLTAVQQGTVNGGGGITHAVYAGPTGSQADTAVAFVFKQLGCPYSYGSTGPCGVGFDCSGLVSRRGRPRASRSRATPTAQWAALPHISTSALQPGDLLFYNGIGHVAMYVGGGMIIDAPSAGQPVRELSMNAAWYAGSFDGAARP